MKKFLTILLLASVTVFSAGCDDYLDVNKNIDSPDRVDAHLYLAGILGYYVGYYYDLRGLMPLCQYTGTSGSGYNYGLYHTYIVGSDYMGEVWKMVYWTQGKNLENMINQATAAQQWKLAGIGYAIKANSWDMLTKEYGEAPLRQAYEPGRLAFDYEYQPEIMDSVRAWANRAIEYLSMTDNTNYGSTLTDNDVMYGGDAEKWKKFAYGVIVRDLSAMSHKTDFVSGGYADQLIAAAQNALQTSDDDATVTVPGGEGEVTSTNYNNFLGVHRGNLGRSYWQQDYPIQLATGTVPVYDEENGEKTRYSGKYTYKPADVQYITDTTFEVGHYDPRLAAKFATMYDPNHEWMGIRDSVANPNRRYYGGGFSGSAGSQGTAPTMFNTSVSGTSPNMTNAGTGRWIFRNDAPIILMTASEIQFCVAEAYWMKGDKANALAAFKKAIALDMDFTVKYLTPGTPNSGEGGGDKITKALFTELANEYLEGPYVGGLTVSTLTLSHIMLQKYMALWPWGALETWVDMRKVMYDIQYTGDYPSNGNGWTTSILDQKWDSDPTKIYKGYFMPPAITRGSSFSSRNHGSPSFRIRPRYNSEYMWNLKALEGLKPISGTDDKYSCSFMWFCYPGDQPQSL